MGKKKAIGDEIDCTKAIKMERFVTDADEASNSWFHIFCLPYSLLLKIWDSCMSACKGTNQVFVYIMFLQYLICRIKAMVTPHPIFTPYYFYMFCQILLMGLFLALFWFLWGDSLVMPFVDNVISAFIGRKVNPPTALSMISKSKPKAKVNETRRTVSFRKYCFTKKDLYTMPLDNSPRTVSPAAILTFVLQVLCGRAMLRHKWAGSTGVYHGLTLTKK
ncbi:hypothetical protein SFRURICE_020934 [Spodoptera frugiperda]|nr:hypothetical protein SFRURICE_020934 [Spodoptera frugiperda]